MNSKKILLERLDEAISSKETSSQTRQLLIDIRDELQVARSKNQYMEIAVKLVDLISAGGILYEILGSG